MEQINVLSKKRVELIDITSQVRNIVKRSGIKEGVCYVYAPHTTAAVTINENADPNVIIDIQNHLSKLVPFDGHYSHAEGNSDAHIKTSFLGCSKNILVTNGDLLLGTWQGIFFCEFDGPRNRKLHIKVIAG
ncbi:MAG: secondary thiamine-phosphate synthase enzyme YjbQ [Thermodesulfobacteriota bacterium]|jgi:secondary thiamine-phosphate synthase enzyme|nr:MAG: secondary thiamine-phosphate synthase enzyme YjbQ [Thermodesulfobacteriota bacterium]